MLAGENLHDSLTALAASMVGSGMSQPASIAQLERLMQASSAPHDARWHDRLSEIPRLVRSGAEKFGRSQNQENGTAQISVFPLIPFEKILLDSKRCNYLVKGLLPDRGLVVIWGPPKCYTATKTIFA